MSHFPYKNRIRKEHHDYNGEYIYFVTLNMQTRPLQLMGKIKEGKMHLSEAGEMVVRWYNTLESKFPYVECHEMVIMPDHMHFVIQIHEDEENLNQGGSEATSQSVRHTGRTHVGDTHVGGDPPPSSDPSVGTRNPNHNKHLGTKLITVLQWFKTMTTNEYIRGVKEKGWPRFRKKLWQRSYHELIVYDDRAFKNIENYIKNNPKNWKT